MNLQSLASAATTAITPSIAITIKVSTGSTTSADGSRVATYSEQAVAGQVQALTQSDLRQIEGMNVQGQLASVYLPGDFNGIIRANSAGGDVLVFGGQTWKIVSVPEQWPNWTRVIACLQA